MTTPPDDERTVLRGVTRPGAAPLRELGGGSADALPPGTRLHEFQILSVIGQGGFGIVYLAHDTTLDRRVAIKEYMPSALATRTQAMTVAVRSTRHTETFTAGLRSFINEARLLAQFDHPSLLKVHRFWEAHGTAYMAMPYYAGTTFGQLLAKLERPPDEARLTALLHPLLDALGLMHEAHCYHRDIAPDNILILPDGRPMLLDFGAARRVIGDMTQALTVILKTGYAPVEQYGEMPGMSQGPWTDLYALGSVLQFAITGHTPPQAVARFLADKREPLAVTAAGRYSDRFLQAIDRALAVLPKDRPQSTAEMRALLGPMPDAATGMETVAEPVSSPAAVERYGAVVDERTVELAKARAQVSPARGRRALAIGGALVLALATAAGAHRWWTSRDGADGRAAVPGAPEASAPGSSPTETATTPAPTPEAAPEAAPAPALAPAPAPTPTPEPTPTPAPAPSSKQSSTSSPPGDERKAVGEPPVDSTPPAPTPAPAPVPIPTPPPAPEPAPPTPEPATPARHASPSPAPARPPRAAVTPAPEPATPQRIPKKKLSNERCADIIQRASLGEEPSAAEKDFLKQECGP